MKLPWASSDHRYETVLNQGTEFTGTLLIKAPVHIHGRVVGNVQCEDYLVIGEESQIIGDLSAKLISIGGKVNGKVEATELVTLLSTARLTGEIYSPRLTVFDGAIVEGTIHMSQLDFDSVSQLESKPVPRLESKPVTQSGVEPVLQPAAESVAQDESQSEAEPALQPAAEVESQSEAEPVLQPASQQVSPAGKRSGKVAPPASSPIIKA